MRKGEEREIGGGRRKRDWYGERQICMREKNREKDGGRDGDRKGYKEEVRGRMWWEKREKREERTEGGRREGEGRKSPDMVGKCDEKSRGKKN